MDCSLPGSSVHGIFQARALEWAAIAFSRETLLDDLRGKFRPEILPFLVCTHDYSVHLDWEHIHAGLRVQVMEPDC